MIRVNASNGSDVISGPYQGAWRGPRVYSDGGLLNALPLWAAAEMGATRVVAVHVLPFGLPSAGIRFFLRGLRSLTPHCPGNDLPGIEATLIAPDCHLGSSRELLFATRDRIEQWIERGAKDASAILRTGILATG